MAVLGWLWFFFYCSFALISPPLFDDADSVHAEVAREMVLRHDPVTLYANGIRYLEKAPLLYWSMAGCMRVLGVHNSTARLPLAVFTLLLVLMAERFGREAFRTARAGLYAGMIVLSSFGMFIFTRILIPDAVVCLWLTLAVWCFWRTELADAGTRAPLLPCLGFGAACALNILTKGLIGLVFPAGTVVVYLLLTRGVRAGLRRLAQLRPFEVLLTFLLLAAPWHIAAARANPDEGMARGLTHVGRWLPFPWRGWSVPEPTPGNVHGWAWFYFVNEHLLRYLDLRVPRDYDTVPLLLFWGLLLVWMLPWSAFLYPALRTVPWRAAMRRTWLWDRTIGWATCRATESAPLTVRQKTLLLLGIAAVLPLVFFSFSTRQEYYVLPAIPFLSVLIAGWLDREAHETETIRLPETMHATGRRVSIGLLVFGCAAALVCGVLAAVARPPQAGVELATLLKQNPTDYALSFGHFLDLNIQAMAFFRLPLAIAGVALLAGTVAAWRLRGNYRPHAANMVLLAAAMGFLLASHVGLTTFSPVLTSKSLAQAIGDQLRPEDLIVVNGEYESASSMGFYLRRNDLRMLHGHSANLWYGSFFQDAPQRFETDESLRLRWLSAQRVFLWTTPETLPSLPSPVFLIAEGGGKEIVSNLPNREPHKEEP